MVQERTSDPRPTPVHHSTHTIWQRQRKECADLRACQVQRQGLYSVLHGMVSLAVHQFYSEYSPSCAWYVTAVPLVCCFTDRIGLLDHTGDKGWLGHSP